MSNLLALSGVVFFVQVTEPIVKQHKPEQASLRPRQHCPPVYADILRPLLTRF